MTKEPRAGETSKHGFSALRPTAEAALGTLSDMLLARLGITTNLSMQHFLGNAYERPHARLFNSGLTAVLMARGCVETLSRIALGAVNADSNLLKERSVRIEGVEERVHKSSGSSYICAVPDAHSMRMLNQERKLLLVATATAFDRSPKGLLSDQEFTISFIRIGSKTKPADPATVDTARSIISEHCPERIPLGAIVFQSVVNEIFEIRDLVDYADKAGIEPVALYPLRSR